MHTNDNLVLGLRTMAASGRSVSEMVHWLFQQIPVEPSTGRIQVIAALQQAFGLSIGDASAVGAWRIFPGGTWTEEQVEAFLLPRIHAAEEHWNPPR